MKLPGGAGLKALLPPSRRFGAEFLENKVRLCAFSEKDGRAVSDLAFEGSYAEAEAVARSRGLAYEGLYAALSHIPFKLGPLETGRGGEEDLSPQADLLRPTGLSMESVDFQGASIGGAGLLLLAREDALRAFREGLPEPLGSLWNLTAGPLALTPFLDLENVSGRWAAILAEESYVHVLFFQGRNVESYVKVFAGLESAGKEPETLVREMKKALVYHYGTRFPGASLGAAQIWKDGPGGEIASALKSLGIPQAAPVWDQDLAPVPEAFRVAGAMALSALRGREPLGFSLPRNDLAESRRAWRRRAGALLRLGAFALAGAALALALLAITGLGLSLAVDAKSRLWAGELRKWEAFQKTKAAVDTEFSRMQGLLSRRTASYAGLQRVAALAPPELWLESWEIEASASGRSTHRLAGHCLQEGKVAEFLSNLEKDGRFQSVKLKSTERIKGETVERKTGIAANKRDLTRFQMGLTE